MNKLLLVLVLVLVFGGGAYLYMNKYSVPATQPAESQVTTTPEAVSGASGASEGAAMKAGATKEFAVSGNEFAFTPKALTVARGDTVKVTFTNTGTYPHNWVVDELNLKTKTVAKGESDTITFVADKTGTFTFYCAIDSHKDKGMMGQLIVE